MLRLSQDLTTLVLVFNVFEQHGLEDIKLMKDLFTYVN